MTVPKRYFGLIHQGNLSDEGIRDQRQEGNEEIYQLCNYTLLIPTVSHFLHTMLWPYWTS